MTNWKWDSYFLTGFLGVIIYGILFIYSIYEIITSNYLKNNKIKYLNYKISFHLIFSLCNLFEVIYYFSYMIIHRFILFYLFFTLICLFFTLFFFILIQIFLLFYHYFTTLKFSSLFSYLFINLFSSFFLDLFIS